MTDKALENAECKRDSLAAEINSLAQRMEELKRDIVMLDDWIREGMNLLARMGRRRSRRKATNLRHRQPAQHEPKVTRQRKRLRVRLKS